MHEAIPISCLSPLPLLHCFAFLIPAALSSSTPPSLSPHRRSFHQPPLAPSPASLHRDLSLYHSRNQAQSPRASPPSGSLQPSPCPPRSSLTILAATPLTKSLRALHASSFAPTTE